MILVLYLELDRKWFSVNIIDVKSEEFIFYV